MSLPEVLLWRELRQQELRWRKGAPAGPFAVEAGARVPPAR